MLAITLLAALSIVTPPVADERTQMVVRAAADAKVTLADAVRVATEKSTGAFVIEAALEWEERGARWGVSFVHNDALTKAEIDAVSGKIAAQASRPLEEATLDRITQLRKLATIGRLDLLKAVEAGAKRVPGGRPVFVKVSPGEGALVYDVRFLKDGRLARVTVDALSGEATLVPDTKEGAAETEAPPQTGAEGGEAKPAEDAPAKVAPSDATVPAKSPRTEARVFGFDADALGSLPPGWKAEGTNQLGPVATWQVARDGNAPTGTRVLALVRSTHKSLETFNLCWSAGTTFHDGTIDVKLKAVFGTGDQGGGIAWRVVDRNSYYICRWNPLEKNFRLYLVRDGKRKQLASAEAAGRTAVWHSMRIEHRGDRIRCTFDGEAMIDIRESTLAAPGGVGVWTKADAETAFDDLKVAP